VPSEKTFHRVLGVVVGGMSICILVLSLLVTTSGPRVRHVVVHNHAGYGGIASVSQGLTLVFDRPVKSADFESAIELRPEADYSVSHRGQQVSITFDENLLSNTQYVLTAGPALEDEAGHRMKRAYTYEFATTEPTFTYLERNYDAGAMDRIVERAPLSRKSQTLFEASQIEFFARNDDYLAAVVPKTQYTNELRVMDLENGGGGAVDVPGAVSIDNLELSPVDDQLIFVTRVVAGTGADEAFRKGYEGKLYRYDVEAQRLRPVDTLSDKGNVESALYSRDGGALLYQTFDGTYYLTGAAGAPKPYPLGSYAGSGGFNQDDTKIVFETVNGGAVIYDARKRRSQELPYKGIRESGSTPKFLHNSDALVYRQSLLDERTGETISQVSIADATGEVETRVSSPPGAYFFDDPVVSLDDRYVLVEAAPESSEVDYYPSNPQPEGARLVLYDRFERRVVEEVRGMDPVWSR